METSKRIRKLIARRKDQETQKVVEELTEEIEKNSKDIDGLKFYRHYQTNADPNYDRNTIRLLPNGRFCIEKRDPFERWESENMVVDYGDGEVFINCPTEEQLYKLAYRMFGPSDFQKYEIHKGSGYDAKGLAFKLLTSKISIIS